MKKIEMLLGIIFAGLIVFGGLFLIVSFVTWTINVVTCGVPLFCR